jgi:MSHA biogenesis protein MshI
MLGSTPGTGTALGHLLTAWPRARAARARVGLQIDERRFAVARLVAAPGARPVLEHVESLAADHALRTGALRRLVHAGLFRDAQVALALSAGQYELHPLPAPVVPDEELRDAVRWQLRGVAAFTPEEATVDFARIPQPPAPDDGAAHAARPQLLVVAARAALVESAVRTLADSGVSATVVDVPEFAQRNLAQLGAGAGCTAWLSFEADACLLTVQLDGELCFARRFQAQGANLHVQADGSADSVTQYFVERVAVHTQRSLELFERQSGLPPVAQLWVAPHTCAPLLAATLAERTSVETHVFDVAAAFDIAVASTHDLALAQPNPDWLIAAGAALRDLDAGARASGIAASLRALLGGFGARGSGTARPGAATAPAAAATT